MDAINEIYEKKLQIQQSEERLQQMLEDLRGMEPIDDSENLETPVKEETEEPKTPRKKLYKWATEGEEDIMYEFLFKFMTGKTFEALREHFMSLAKKTEMDMAIMQIMCIFHNRKNNESFKGVNQPFRSLFHEDRRWSGSHNGGHGNQRPGNAPRFSQGQPRWQCQRCGRSHGTRPRGKPGNLIRSFRAR
ncbi:hypothetical protein PIB30_048913 [Stylosanthes scabra]|uniref:Uncharacterized protein n=1 Tax=Stylosanthes scabra TaxID=79078 RepID=A0ABU6UH07_9FABA|nr:hypothetical protein [Stylosanthes scabra]